MTESVGGNKLVDLLVNVQSILNAASVKCHVVDEVFQPSSLRKIRIRYMNHIVNSLKIEVTLKV